MYPNGHTPRCSGAHARTHLPRLSCLPSHNELGPMGGSALGSALGGLKVLRVVAVWCVTYPRPLLSDHTTPER